MDGNSVATKLPSVASFIDTNVLVYAEAGDDLIRQTKALRFGVELAPVWYTEDLNAGEVIHGVKLLNPFAD
jgi:predicted nucleic acid-binding protein